MIHHQGKIRPCHGANNECIPVLAQIKCLTPEFLAPKAPSSNALPPTSRDCTCCLQHMGFLMESKITGVQTWGGSGRCLAHPRQVQALPEPLLCTWSSDFRKKAINGGFLLLSWITSGEPGFRALPESPVQTHTFLFFKKDNFHLFSLHQTFKSSIKHWIKQCQCWQLPGQQQRVCAHHISHIVQTTPLEVLTSQFKMLKYFTPPFSHCPLSPSPCNHF